MMEEMNDPKKIMMFTSLAVHLFANVSHLALINAKNRKMRDKRAHPNTRQ